MKTDQVFTGRVIPGGMLVMDRPLDYGRYVRTFAGQYVEVTIRKRRTKRTPKASRFYFGYVVVEIAKAAGYSKEEAHDALRYEFLRDGDGPLVRVKSTADLSPSEHSEYVEHCMALGARIYGIVWQSRAQWEAA